MVSFGDVMVLFGEWSCGNGSVFNQLLPFVYVELRGIVVRQLRSERVGYILQLIALVHEVYFWFVD